MAKFEWWREGVVYQIYPRSFADGNGDGLGDLAGILAHLEYLAELGVDALWLSPIQPSPDVDFGYDVSDYCAVDPRYGTLAEFDRLLAKAHSLGMRVILDMVMNHTSDQHAWFKESRSSRDNPKRDWYIWRPPSPSLPPFLSFKMGAAGGGSIPNNWQASFGGKAWAYDDLSGEYYLHLFTSSQPDLNWRNPQVRQALLDVFRFWLERGVDGFRLDVFNAYFKDERLRDNPPKFGLRGFDRQRHVYDMDQPELLPLLQELRGLLDSYPQRYAVGEPYLPTLEKALHYCGPDRLHAAFSFDFTSGELFFPWNPYWLVRQVRRREAACQAAGVWPTTVLSNHDLPRAASRYALGEDDAQAKIAMALLLTLRGTPFIYYGEEIGMRDIHLKKDEILDPPGKLYWPLYKGRDGCRSPMQWDAGLFGGFSTGKPWLPLHPDYLQRNVLAQQEQPGSMLNFTRHLLRLRKQHAALRQGEMSGMECKHGVLSYLRSTGEQTLLVAINFKRHNVKFIHPEGNWGLIFSNIEEGSDAKHLAPYEVRILKSKKV